MVCWARCANWKRTTFLVFPFWRQCPARTISGHVLEDAHTSNNNSGNVPIPVVSVGVVDLSGVLVATSMAESNGAVTKVEIPPGLYTLLETNNPGFDDVSDSNVGDPKVITVDVGTGDSTVRLFVDERPCSPPSFSVVPTTPSTAVPQHFIYPKFRPIWGRLLIMLPATRTILVMPT